MLILEMPNHVVLPRRAARASINKASEQRRWSMSCLVVFQVPGLTKASRISPFSETASFERAVVGSLVLFHVSPGRRSRLLSEPNSGGKMVGGE